MKLMMRNFIKNQFQVPQHLDCTVTAVLSTTMAPIVISIDGNIGAGKSTLLERIREAHPEWHALTEPVSSWTSYVDESGTNLLEHFYADRKRWSYTFQNCALLTRIRTLSKALDGMPQDAVCLTERTVLTDRYVFADMLRQSGDLNKLEWDLYCGWFDEYAKRLSIRGVIYVTTSAQTSKQRIRVRNRAGEDKIEQEYLDALQEQHERWLAEFHLPVLRISTEEGVSTADNIASIETFIAELRAREADASRTDA